jgi:hypothetical protein
MKKYLSHLPAVLLIAGAILRIATIGAAAIWYDEAATLYRSSLPFWQLSTNLVDQSGCLVLDLLLHGIMWISPHSLILLRLPALVAGLVSLWMVWLITKRLDFNLEQKILAAALVSFLPGLLWIGQDARVYGLTACIFMVAVWYLINASWLGFTAACGLLLYCHNTGILLVAGLVIVFITHIIFVETEMDWIHFRFEVNNIPKMLGILFITTIPVLVRILYRGELSNGPMQPWAPQLTFDWFSMSVLQSIWAHVFSPTIIGFLGFAILLAAILIIPYKIKQPLLVLVWLVPFAILIFVSLVFNNIFLYRTISPLIYPFCLWLAFTLAQDPVYVGRKMLTAGWMLMLVLSLVTWDPAARGGGLDLTSAEIRARFEPGDLIVYTTYTVSMPFDYYISDLPHLMAHLASSSYLNEPGDGITTDPSRLNAANRIWFISPDDGLINADEMIFIDALHGPSNKPAYQVFYKQAATINVWVVDGKYFSSKLSQAER